MNTLPAAQMDLILPRPEQINTMTTAWKMDVWDRLKDGRWGLCYLESIPSDTVMSMLAWPRTLPQLVRRADYPTLRFDCDSHPFSTVRTEMLLPEVRDPVSRPSGTSRFFDHLFCPRSFIENAQDPDRLTARLTEYLLRPRDVWGEEMELFASIIYEAFIARRYDCLVTGFIKHQPL